MTNINSSSRNRPFLLKPAGKDYLWGGTRLITEYNRPVQMEPLAETWECSTHPDGLSIIDSGIFQGKTLKEVLDKHPEFIGTHPNMENQLPILVKLIDAKRDLSIQVHPDDDYAEKHEGGQSGKTEMWYVVDAAKDARLVYGFYHDVTKQEIRDGIENGNIEKYLQKVKIQKNDVFFIEAGTVHAIGAGALIAEVQESSNLTYRLYDYGRIDKNGKERELHVEKALDVANLQASNEPRQPMRLLKYRQGEASEFLCRCKYFQVERHLLNTETSRNLVDFRTKRNSFKIFLCLEGCGIIFLEDGETLNFFKGDCVFVPANSVEMKFHGKAQLLGITC